MRRNTIFGLASLLVFLPFSLGADEPETKTVSTTGIQFQVPKTWKATRPASSMRKSQLEVAPVEGDKQPAEMVLYVFGGGAGTVEQNIERWKNQFKAADGGEVDMETSQVKAQNAEVTRAECAGTFTAPSFTVPFGQKAGPQENYRLLGAIVETDEAGYFFKLIGPDKTVKSAEPAFDAMLKSIKVGR